MSNDTESTTRPIMSGIVTSTESPSERSTRSSIIAVSVTLGVTIILCLLIYILYRVFFRNLRQRHGCEQGNKKSEYFDQFQVNDNDLTVNSKTAIRWDDEEKRSSGIADCDDTSLASGKEVAKITSGKRVFEVSTVTETPSRVNRGQVVIRVPKGFENVARSLHTGDLANGNYTLALIDKASKTVHNIDTKEFRYIKKAPSPNISGGTRSTRLRLPRYASDGNSISERIPRSRVTPKRHMAHDEPDRGTDHPVIHSADEAYTREMSSDSLSGE